MTNFDFLKKYEELQIGVMTSGGNTFPFGQYCLGTEDKSSFWNHLLTNKVLEQTEIDEVTKYAGNNDLKPAIYFENRKDLANLKQNLMDNKFKEINEDSWMFFDKKIDYQEEFDLVKKVKTIDDLKTYIDLFDRCYQKNDPQNVYGELGDYLKSASRSWINLHESDYIEYFIIFDGYESVAVSALTNYDGVGYISNVGSLKKVRGKGFGKIATLYAIYQSQKNGNTLHCLATEENTYANEFYKKLGFETRFTALLFEQNL